MSVQRSGAGERRGGGGGGGGGTGQRTVLVAHGLAIIVRELPAIDVEPIVDDDSCALARQYRVELRLCSRAQGALTRRIDPPVKRIIVDVAGRLTGAQRRAPHEGDIRRPPRPGVDERGCREEGTEGCQSPST